MDDARQTAGRLVLEVAERIDLLILHWDGECYSLDALLRPAWGGGRRLSHRPRLEDALRDLLGEQLLRRCTVCGREKPAPEFIRDRRRPDGLFPHCRTCARIRAALRRHRTDAG